jgi:hypothetical protein
MALAWFIMRSRDGPRLDAGSWSNPVHDNASESHPYTYRFLLDHNGDLLCIKVWNTVTGNVEVRSLKANGNYQTPGVNTSTHLPAEPRHISDKVTVGLLADSWFVSSLRSQQIAAGFFLRLQGQLVRRKT